LEQPWTLFIIAINLHHMKTSFYKCRERLMELHNKFCAAFGTYVAKCKKTSEQERRLGRFADNNGPYLNASLLDWFYAILFVISCGAMWATDRMIVSPFADLFVDGIEDPVGNNIVKVLISFAVLVSQVMIILFNKAQEEEYEKPPHVKTKLLVISRKIKFLFVAAFYTMILVFKVIGVADTGDFTSVLIGLFGFCALFILAILIHLALSLFGRWLIDATIRVIYTIGKSIILNDLAKAKAEEAKAEDAARRAYVAEQLWYEDCIAEHPEKERQFTLPFGEQERAFIKRHYPTKARPVIDSVGNSLN
jgi:hypothetical protein